MNGECIINISRDDNYSHQYNTLNKDIDDKGEMEEAYTEFEHFDFEHSQSFQIGWSTLSHVVDPDKIGVEYLKAKVFYFSKYHKPINLEKYLSWKKTMYNESDGRTETGLKEKNIPKEYEQEVVKNPKQIDSSPEVDTSVVSPVVQSEDVGACKEQRDLVINHLGNIGAVSMSSNNYSCDGISELLRATSLDNDFKVNGSKTDTVSSGNDENEPECSAELGKDKCGVTASENCAKEDEGSTLSLLEIASYIQNGLPIPGLVSLEVLPTNETPTPSSRERKLKPWETSVEKSVDS